MCEGSIIAQNTWTLTMPKTAEKRKNKYKSDCRADFTGKR